MFIPNLPQEKISDVNGNITNQWNNFFTQVQQNLQQAVSEEGFLIPSISSQVIPPATQSNLQIIQASFGQPTGALAGTLVFDPYEVNGATPPARNGQLKILLNDGTFHSVTNT